VGSSPVAAVRLVLACLAALGLLASCGRSSDAPDLAAFVRDRDRVDLCTSGSDVDEGEMVRLARILSPGDEAYANYWTLPSLDDARRLGVELRLGEIRAVERVDGAPWNILPGVEPDDPPTNEFAGNAAFWSGVRLQIDVGDTTVATESARVTGALVGTDRDIPTHAADLESLVGLCVVVATAPSAADGPHGPHSVAAVARRATSPPHLTHPSFRIVVDEAAMLTSLAQD
jgi:hypothetical protein